MPTDPPRLPIGPLPPVHSLLESWEPEHDADPPAEAQGADVAAILTRAEDLYEREPEYWQPYLADVRALIAALRTAEAERDDADRVIDAMRRELATLRAALGTPTPDHEDRACGA